MKYTITSYVVTALAAGVVSVGAMLTTSEPIGPTEVLVSQTTVSASPLDELVQRHEDGYFSASRARSVAAFVSDDPETNRLQNEIINLRIENDSLKYALEHSDPTFTHLIYLLRTRDSLTEAKHALEQGAPNRSAHATVSYMLTFAESELNRMGVDSSLDELLLRLRDDNQYERLRVNENSPE